MATQRWTAPTFAEALVDLLEEPFATPEDVGLDVRRVETVSCGGAGSSGSPSGAGPRPVPRADAARGRGSVLTVELDLADGARFRLAVERVA